MKRTELEKLQGKKIESRMRGAEVPARYGQASGEVADKREQRKRDQAAGLVPFACKLDQALVAQVQALARSRGAPLNEVVDELLRRGLAP